MTSTARGMAAASRDATGEPDELTYINVTAFRADGTDPSQLLRHRPLVAGANELDLDKGGVWILGLAKKGTPSGAASGRGIANRVREMGSIKVIAAGLSSLPVSEQAQGRLDLGGLALGPEGGYESAVPVRTVASSLGLSEDLLRSFGLWDQFMSCLMNADIDSDGVFDIDQSPPLKWEFRTIYQFDLASGPQAEIALDSGTRAAVASPAALAAQLQYEVILWSGAVGLPIPPDGSQGEAILERLDHATSAVSATLSFINAAAYSSPSPQFTYYFRDPDPTAAPTNGDYALRFGQPGSPSYSWRDASFVQPQGEWETLLLPLVVLHAAGDGRLSSVEWKWLEAKGGAWSDPDPREVELRTRQLAFNVSFEDGASGILWSGSSERFARWEVQKVAGSVSLSSGSVTGTPAYLNGTMDLSYLEEYAASVSSISVSWYDLPDNDYSYILSTPR